MPQSQETPHERGFCLWRGFVHPQFVLITPAAALVILALLLPLAALRWYLPEKALDWLLAAFALSAVMHVLAPHVNDLPWAGSNLAALLLPPFFVACFCASAFALLPAPAWLSTRLPAAIAAVLLVWFLVSFYLWGNPGVAGRGLTVTAAFLATAAVVWRYSRLERGVGLELLIVSMVSYPVTSALLVYLRPTDDWRVALITTPYILVGAAAMTISTARAARDMRVLQAKVFNLELTEPPAIHPDVIRARTLQAELQELGRTSAMLNVSLDRVVQASVEELRGVPAFRKAQLDVRVGPMPSVRGDPKLLRILMVQLLRNAVQQSLGVEGAFIAIGMLEERAIDRGEPDHALFFIQDQGPGFDPEMTERMFTPFGKPASDGSTGVGYGLAIAKQIVEGYGGMLWADSAPGQGATFLFTLPRALPLHAPVH